MASGAGQANKLLILSSSTVTYTDGEAGESLVTMVDACLRNLLTQVEWKCEGEVLYVTESMAERARSLVMKHGATHVLLRPTGLAFMHDEVVNAIRARWPRLYRPALRISEFFRGLGGGVRHGEEGPRGWLFRGPRRLAEHLIGVAPRLRVEVATDYVIAAIEELVRLEDVDLMCRLSVGNQRTLRDEAEHRRRLDYFVSHVRQACDRRLVPLADNADLYRESRLAYELGADQWHKTAPMRIAEARAIAEIAASRVEAGRRQGRPH
jgi:hypothetical protein